MLIKAITIAVLIAQPLVTYSIGIETGGPQLRALFRHRGLFWRYFCATFVVMPAIAIAMGLSGRFAQGVWVGLALMSIAPPAPPATRRLRKAGNMSIGLAWQATAFLLAVAMIPLTIVVAQRLGLVASGLNLSWGPLLSRSALFFAGPMLLGLLTRRYLPAVANALVKPVSVAANVALVVLTVLVLIVAVPVIAHYDVLSIAVIVAFVAIAVLVGHLLGGPRRDTRITLVAMLAARFPLPALILAQQNDKTKMILPVILVYIIAGVLLTPLYGRLTKRTSPSAPAAMTSSTTP